MIGDLFTVCTGRIGILVGIIHGKLIDLGGISALLVCGKRIDSVLSYAALLAQNVVQSVMGIVSDSQVIIAAFQDIALGILGIIGGKLFTVDGNRDFLRLVRSKFLGLGKSAEFDRSLLDTIGDIIIGIRTLEIDLDDILGLMASCVFHHKGDVDGIVFRVLDKGRSAVFERGIGKTIAERIGYDAGIVVVSDTLTIVDKVLVSGLIVAVSDIDTFLIGIVVLVSVKAVSHHVLTPLGGIGPLCGIHVDHARTRGIVVAIGIDKPSGRRRIAHKKIGNAVKTHLTGIANPKAGIDLGRSGSQKIAFQRIGGIEEDDDLTELALGLIDEFDFVLGEFKGVSASVHGLVSVALMLDIVRNIVHFAADSGDDDDGSIIVLRKRGSDAVGLKLAIRDFVDKIGRKTGIRVTDGIGILVRIALVLVLVGLVEIPGTRIDADSAALQSLLQSRCIVGIDLGTAGSADDEIVTGMTKKRDLAGLGKRKSGIAVLEKNASFLRQSLCHIGVAFQKLIVVFVLAFEILGVFLGSITDFDVLRPFYVECLVDDIHELQGYDISDAECRNQSCADASKCP